MSLTKRILLAMVAGILLGSLCNVVLQSAELGDSWRQLINDGLVLGVFDVVGRMFVASLKLLVVPLVLVSLICGSSSLGDSARMGPIAVKTIAFYLATTAIAITVALLVAVAVSPGAGVDLVVTFILKWPSRRRSPTFWSILCPLTRSLPWPRAICCR